MLQPSGAEELQKPEVVRVLLLEDERVTAEVIAQYLRRIPGLAVQLESAATLAGARAALEGAPFDLLIVDLHLPDSSGLATLDAIARRSAGLIIVLTADPTPALRNAAIARGAYDFLHKSQLNEASFERLVRLATVQADTVRSLRKSEARLRAIVEAEPECVKLLDAEGRLIEMNPAGLRMIEAESLEALRGHSTVELVAPEHRDGYRALLESVAGGAEASLEFEMIGLKGRRLWVETRAVPLRDRTSGAQQILCITRDVTDVRRLTEDLRRFRLAMDSSADMIVLVDRATMKTIDVNDTICRLTGYPPDELLTLPLPNLPPLTRADLEAAYDRQIADPSKPAGMKSYYRCKDGSRLPFESKRQVARSGGSWIIVATSRDIRERIASEEALRDSEERFRSLVDLSSDFYWETAPAHRLIRTPHHPKHPPPSP